MTIPDSLEIVSERSLTCKSRRKYGRKLWVQHSSRACHQSEKYRRYKKQVDKDVYKLVKASLHTFQYIHLVFLPLFLFELHVSAKVCPGKNCQRHHMTDVDVGAETVISTPLNTSESHFVEYFALLFEAKVI